MDIFVKFTLPYPQESPLSGKTESIKGTNSPKWEHTQKFNIDRKSRQLLRAVKLKGVKFEVFQRGYQSLFKSCWLRVCQLFFSGFLRSDKALGSFEVKMADLETRAEIHDSFDVRTVIFPFET